ncbi:MAG TPA: hypothetical protein VG759_04475 [Candidatus Angelobacter sp.]|jgi:hypothetical protein|nr:hypothetical protein [Candidatus Angelobacter sp.]
MVELYANPRRKTTAPSQTVPDQFQAVILPEYELRHLPTVFRPLNLR